jgi:ABC-type protease/lipase transport system fused ATPase/permease subunit
MSLFQTSALDNHLQHTLIQNLGAVIQDLKRRGGICILVTHREELLSLCDRVLVANDGRVTEFKPDELVQLKSGS